MSDILDDNSFSFEIIFENELNWRQLNEIHFILNKAYSGRSNSFFYTPHAVRRPIARVLCRHEGKLVATSAYFEDLIKLEGDIIRLGGVGLSCSIIHGQGIGNKCRSIVATKISKLLGVDICISRVGEKTKDSTTAKSLIFGFLDMTMSGRQSKSHTWECIAFYKTCAREDVLADYFNKMKKMDGVDLLIGEVF